VIRFEDHERYEMRLSCFVAMSLGRHRNLLGC
jgi:hypothetical protein